MMLQKRIEADLKSAMTAQRADEVSTLRMLKSALQYAAIEKKTAELSDADARQVVQKQIKQRRESIEQFEKAGRSELAGKEARELRVLEAYLPKQLSEAELSVLVAAEVKSAGVVSKKDFGRMMKLLTEKLAGQAESKRISEALGKLLPS